MICQYCNKEFVSKYHPKAKCCSRRCCVRLWQKQHSNEYQRKQRKIIKLEIFNLLGGKCVVCGYKGSALQVDHINGGGRKEIAKVKIHGNSYTYWKQVLVKIQHGYTGYQLLCANCNIEKFYRSF